MDVSTVTVLGNVAAEPRISVGEEQQVDRVNFRVVATQRRLDRETNTWVEAGEYGVNVVCWRALARGVAGSLHLGDPVLVVGRIAERHYEAGGEKRYTTDVTASFVGHDLSKGRSTFKRFPRNGSATQGAGDSSGTAGDPDTAEAAKEDVADGGAIADVPVPFEADPVVPRLAAV